MRNFVNFGALALLILFPLASGCSDGGTTASAKGVLSVLNTAIKKNDETMAKEACTTGYWNGKRDPGNRFFSQAVRKKFVLEEKEIQVQDDRAVAIADVICDGKKVDQLFFYLVKSQGKWSVDGMDESRNHGKYYLEGILPARFILDDYPSNPELQALGEKMIQLAPKLKGAKDDEAGFKSLLEGVLEIKYSSASGLRLLLEVADQELNLASNHWIAPLQRGVIEIRDKSGKEKVFIYVLRAGGEWKMLACHTGWLASDTVLRDY
jgi:hypothetical protein